MNIGKTMLMELKNSWKGLTLFLIIVILLIAGFVQAHPSIREGFEEDKLDGEDNVEVKVREDGEVTVDLSWTYWAEDKEVDDYTVLVGYSPSMIVPLNREDGIETTTFSYGLERDDEGKIPELYFAVIANIGEDRELVGMETSFERRDSLMEIWGVDMRDIRGMISMLWDMWWVLLIGLYLGYISVNSVSKDFEERRMDVIFSTPISKRQYLLEKFTALALYMLFLLTVSGLIMVAAVGSLGELNSVSSTALFLSSVLSWPIFLVIIAFSILGAVYLEDSRKAIGFSFLIILVQYGINVVAGMAEGLEYLGSYTIISYWDHEAILFDEVHSVGNFVFILFLAVLIILGAILIFEKKDIPV